MVLITRIVTSHIGDLATVNWKHTFQIIAKSLPVCAADQGLFIAKQTDLLHQNCRQKT